jgi:hypothetical protein
LLSAAPQTIACSLPEQVYGKIIDLLSRQVVGKTQEGLVLSLRLYEYRWLSIS